MFSVLFFFLFRSFPSILKASEQRHCPRIYRQPAQLCQLCHCFPLAECVQSSINSSRWSFSPRHHHSLRSQNIAWLHIPRLSAPPTWVGVRGDRLVLRLTLQKTQKDVWDHCEHLRLFFDQRSTGLCHVCDVNTCGLRHNTGRSFTYSRPHSLNSSRSKTLQDILTPCAHHIIIDLLKRKIAISVNPLYK